MRAHILHCTLVGALLSLAAVLRAFAGEAPADERRAALAGLPRVPSRASIVKDAKGEDAAAVKQWAQGVIDAKEKRALVELAEIKKQVRKEESARNDAEADRRRREENYNQSWGTIGEGGTVLERRGTVRLRLAFQVPEITTYRLAVEVCHAQQTLANDMVEALGRMDRNGDGKLSGDEYRDAGAIISAAARLFEKLDANDDGYLTPDELETARSLPRNAAEAVRLGRATAEAKTFRIKPFDKDADGVLDMDERKALVMGFVDASLRAAQDAAFYALVAESLSAARDLVAAKFTDVEVAP